MSSQHALFITQCNIGFLATIALVALLLYVELHYYIALVALQCYYLQCW